MIALCAVMGGAAGWVEVEEFGTATQTWRAPFLTLPPGIPAHDTFGRVCAALDGAQCAACFRGWVAAIAERTAGQVIAVDGKAPRRSHDRGAECDVSNAGDHMPSVFLTRSKKPRSWALI